MIKLTQSLQQYLFVNQKLGKQDIDTLYAYIQEGIR